MRRSLAIAPILIGMVAVACPAYAQTVSEKTVGLVGEAEQQCTLAEPTQAPGGSSNFDAPVGGTFSITELADPLTLSTRAANVTVAFPAMCNTAHRVTLQTENNGLWRDLGGVAAGDFGSAVPYDANMVWAGEQQTLQADASGRFQALETMIVTEPASGEILVEIEVAAGATNATTGAPLLAGDYADILRLTVEPQ